MFRNKILTSRQKMRRSLLVLLLIFLSIYPIAGYVTKFYIKNTFEYVSDNLGLNVKINQYNMGFFSSTCQCDMSLLLGSVYSESSLNFGLSDNLILPVTMEIRHGPFIYGWRDNVSIWQNIGNMFKLSKLDIEFDGSNQKAFDELYVDINLLGRLRAQGIFALSMFMGDSVNEQANIYFDTLFYPGMRNVSGFFNIDEINLENNIVVNNLQYKYSTNKNIVDVPEGENSISFDRLYFKYNENKFNLDKFYFNSILSFNEVNSSVAINNVLSLVSLDIGDDNFKNLFGNFMLRDINYKLLPVLSDFFEAISFGKSGNDEVFDNIVPFLEDRFKCSLGLGLGFDISSDTEIDDNLYVNISANSMFLSKFLIEENLKRTNRDFKLEGVDLDFKLDIPKYFVSIDQLKTIGAKNISYKDNGSQVEIDFTTNDLEKDKETLLNIFLAMNFS